MLITKTPWDHLTFRIRLGLGFTFRKGGRYEFLLGSVDKRMWKALCTNA